MWALIEGLPPEAAIHRDHPASWTMRDELAATQVEVVDRWGRQFMSLQGVKRANLPAPIRIPRPHEAERQQPREKRVTTDPAEIKRWFDTGWAKTG